MIPFHPYADLFDLIGGDEFAALAADVRRNGVRERIKILDGKILDGRNRYRAALEAGLIGPDDEPADRPSLFERFTPEVDGNPLDFVFSKNVYRRHLTAGQRAYALAEYEQYRHGGARRPVQDANLQVEPAAALPAPAAAPTRAELAERGHVSERSVASAAVVRDHGVPELKDAVRQGAIAVSAAEKIARLPQDEQPRHLPHGARAIMGSRVEPADSLDYFPTPPWATRALIEYVLPQIGQRGPATCAAETAWEPACGEGHIAEVLCEYFGTVMASDIHGYGYGAVADFLTTDAPGGFRPDWIVTNPPFNDKAEAFVLRALDRAQTGVAMFLRLQWLETVGRYERIFAPHPPALIAQFAERVPLCKGRWDPDGDTATAYLWIVWHPARRAATGRTEFTWIAPGCRDGLTRPDDRERFTAHPVIKRRAAVCDEAFDAATGEIGGSSSPSPLAGEGRGGGCAS